MNTEYRIAIKGKELKIAVQANQSTVRALATLEMIAAHQPVGVSELARLLQTDKNAIQRAVVSLAEAGWIALAPKPAKGWELTAHIFAVAFMCHGKNDLRLRAKTELDALRNETGETVLMTIPDLRHFIVADVFESRQIMRTAPTIGTIAPARDSASGLAVLPYLAPDAQIAMLGSPPDQDLLSKFSMTLQNGYAVSIDTPVLGATSIAAPIFGLDEGPLGSVVVVAPTERLPGDRHAAVGAMVLKAARNLSYGFPQVEAGK